jgi:hypothetical protein
MTPIANEPVVTACKPKKGSAYLRGGVNPEFGVHPIHTPSKLLLYPVLAPIFSPVAGIHPQMFEAGELHMCSLHSSVLIPSQSITLALWTFALSTKPSVSTSRWRF